MKPAELRMCLCQREFLSFHTRDGLKEKKHKTACVEFSAIYINLNRNDFSFFLRLISLTHPRLFTRRLYKKLRTLLLNVTPFQTFVSLEERKKIPHVFFLRSIRRTTELKHL